ncbi:MAG: 3-oxoacyl-ACP synthase III family protein [Anaerorhabdus sp.]
MKNRIIVGMGCAICDTRIDNEQLKSVMDTSDEWISSRTGIHSRYISVNENSSDLAQRAATLAIEDSGVNKEEIDLIIVATMTPDHITPSTACILQSKLGLNDSCIMAFDINAACTGFVYALQIASNMLLEYKCALVVGVDINSKLLDWHDRSTSILFGDGAGAVVLKSTSCNNEMINFAQSKGDEEGVLRCNGIVQSSVLDNASREVGFLHQNGSEVFRFAVASLQEALAKVLEKANKSIDDIDLIIPHQANIRIISNVARKLKIPMEKFYTILEEFGNTSAASIPMALAMAKKDGKIHAGMKIIMVGFGSGFTYAATYYEV